MGVFQIKDGRTKVKSFYFHYNKPASLKAGKPQITVHTGKACLLVDNVVCNVPTAGRIRKTQPRFVVAGKARSVVIEGGVALIS
jgi:hypothetical protein